MCLTCCRTSLSQQERQSDLFNAMASQATARVRKAAAAAKASARELASKASAFRCHGPGLVKATVRQPAIFTIEALDKARWLEEAEAGEDLLRGGVGDLRVWCWISCGNQISCGT